MSAINPAVDAAPRLPATERRNPASMELDAMSSLEILRLMNDADHEAMDAVAAVLQPLSELVDAALAQVRRGGRVHYYGAGTSGRLGILDAAELPPTFRRDDVVIGHIAGGDRALQYAVEGSEDSAAAGEQEAAGLGPLDVAIGLAASGGTPYVRGALMSARDRGALTALVTSNPAAPLAQWADYVVAPDTGAEVLTGSTRLKAGTAEKVILNGFSTALMVGLGLTYSNLMVSVSATNVKLRDRSVRILAEVTGGTAEEASVLLESADGDLRLATVSFVSGRPVDDARLALQASGGAVRAAVAALAQES